MRKILFVAAIIALGFTTANAQYGPRDDRYRNDDYRDRREYRDNRNSDIDYMQREARQQINDAIRSRSLSQREAHMLMREYDRIEARQRNFSHRGRLSNREERILRDDLRRLMADTHRLSRRGDGWARRGRY